MTTPHSSVAVDQLLQNYILFDRLKLVCRLLLGWHADGWVVGHQVISGSHDPELEPPLDHMKRTEMSHLAGTHLASDMFARWGDQQVKKYSMWDSFNRVMQFQFNFNICRYTKIGWHSSHDNTTQLRSQRSSVAELNIVPTFVTVCKLLLNWHTDDWIVWRQIISGEWSSVGASTRTEEPHWDVYLADNHLVSVMFAHWGDQQVKKYSTCESFNRVMQFQFQFNICTYWVAFITWQHHIAP